MRRSSISCCAGWLRLVRTQAGTAQRSELPRLTRLWNPLPATRARLIPSRSQTVTKLLQESLASHRRANASHCLPVDSGGSSAPVRGDPPPRTSQVARVGYPVPQLSIAAVGICFAPLIELALNAQEPDLIGPIIRVHGWFLRHRKPRRFPACLRHVHGSPVLGLLRRLRPLNLTLSGLARCARVPQPEQSVRVPMFQRLTLRSVGGVLCPWRYRIAVEKERTAIELDPRAHQPRT
jgi:hypothetical protein